MGVIAQLLVAAQDMHLFQDLQTDQNQARLLTMQRNLSHPPQRPLDAPTGTGATLASLKHISLEVNHAQGGVDGPTQHRWLPPSCSSPCKGGEPLTISRITRFLVQARVRKLTQRQHKTSSDRTPSQFQRALPRAQISLDLE